MALVAHLGHDLVLAGRLGQHAGLVDAVGQGLLDIDVLAAPDGRQGDDGVGVVGRGHDDRVDVLLLVEHDAEILVGLGLGILGEGLGRIAAGIDIAEGDDVFALAGGQVAGAHAADADAGDVQPLTGGGFALGSENMPRNDRQGRRCGCGFDKVPAIDGLFSVFHVRFSFLLSVVRLR